MEKNLIILRGLPGSGKSTFAKLLGRAVCTADDWFMRSGKYEWRADLLSEAHDWCMCKCRRFMKKGVDRIIIANTNINERAMRPYFDMAKDFGYTVFTVIVENRHGNSNIHNVPDENLVNMEKRFSIKLI
jgi:predicted kinase